MKKPTGARRTALAIATSALAALALAPPVGAAHQGEHPTTRSERMYFHCAGPTKVENVNLVVSGPTSWNAEPPTQSLQQGGGCGSVDSGALRGGNPQTLYDAVFRGTFTGNLRDMTLELHNVLIGRVRSGGAFTVRVRMLIDEVPVFPETVGAAVTVTPERSSNGTSEKLVISIPDLGCTREITDADGNVVEVVKGGLVAEDGDGTTERTIKLAIDSYFAERAGLWAWDATDVPAGITFNPASLAAAQARPTTPAVC